MTRPDLLRLLAAATLGFGLAAAAHAQTAGEAESDAPVAAEAEPEATKPEAESTADAPAEAEAGTEAPAGDEASSGDDAAAEPAADAETGADAAEPATDAPVGAEAADPDAADVAATAGVDADTPVAVINGQPLTLGELIALRRDLPEQYQALPDEVLLQGLTEQMVDQTLLEAAAREAGLAERPDVALSLRNQERAVLADAYLQAEMAERVTADALRQAYEAQFVDAEPVAEVRASHILVDSREKAEDLVRQLDEGADFAKLAEDHGTDSTATSGGDLGWFGRGDMVPSFGEAAFATEPGEIAGPVESPYGWHVIKVVDRRDRPVPEFEEVQAALLEQVAQAAQTAIVEELRQAAEIELAEPTLPPAVIRDDALIQAE